VSRRRRGSASRRQRGGASRRRAGIASGKAGVARGGAVRVADGGQGWDRGRRFPCVDQERLTRFVDHQEEVG
jgi:hypothetical protein